ncbi:MFS monosaccharide transporter [Paraphaeosphaeria sporulosa]
MDKIHRFNVVHRFEKRALLIASSINCIAGLSILFFGYDQGMMGGVNTAYDYYTRMGFGHKGADGGVVVTNDILQGGIVSIYYLGTLVGALVGGWFGDRFGRIKTIFLGAAIGVVGASLQTSAMDHQWMICARLVNGWGTGILNSIIPVWATETAEHTSRGQFIAIEFTLNIFGVVLAYWIEYGCSFYGDGTSSFIWRFPIAFQIPMLLTLMALVMFFPESPRWLVKVGREDEARYVLSRLRGNVTGEEQEKTEAEFQDIVTSVEIERSGRKGPQSYFHMLFGIGSGKLHTGRRVQLVIWLQIMQEWVGIAGVTIYAPTIFGIAGMSPEKRQWIAGLNNIFYMFSTLICVFTLDKIGRRWTLYWGSVGQGIAMALAGGFSYLGQQGTLEGNAGKASAYGNAAVSMVYIFTFIFGATWLTVPWLYPAEIFPLEVRAKGNAWGVVGWSIGNGWLTLLCPVMFKALSEKTLYIFAACNAITIPMVWALYPETNQRTLEEIDLLFAADSIWNWEAEKNFTRLQEQMGVGMSGSRADEEAPHSRKGSVVRGMSLHYEEAKP